MTRRIRKEAIGNFCKAVRPETDLRSGSSIADHQAAKAPTIAETTWLLFRCSGVRPLNYGSYSEILNRTQQRGASLESSYIYQRRDLYKRTISTKLIFNFPGMAVEVGPIGA